MKTNPLIQKKKEFTEKLLLNRGNLFPADHRMDSSHHSSHNHRHYSAGRPAGAAQPRCLSPILSRRKLVARATLENSGSFACGEVCSQGRYPAGDRRHVVSSQRQKSQRRRFLARCGSFDKNQNRLRVGAESCRIDFAGSTSLGRRAAWAAHQHASASKERKIAHRTGCRNARRSRRVAWKQEDSRCGRWILRIAGRAEHNEHDDHFAHASRCFALRFAAETQTTRPGQTPKTRCRIAQTQVDGCTRSHMDTGNFYRSRQNSYPTGVFAKSSLVQGQQNAGAACDLAGAERQGARRLFFHDQRGDENRRRAGCLRRPVGYRRYVQKCQTMPWHRAAADVGEERPRASSWIGTLAVFDGLVLVLPTTPRQTNVPNLSVVCEQNHTQLCRRPASLAKGFVAAANYYDVREFHRT